SSLQLAVGVTLYALFTILFTQQFKQSGIPVLLIAAISAALHALLTLFFGMPVGWSFVISMLSATFLGALLFSKVEGL
ncbi:MAG TPA: branched-chain amino acid ABC transporter permease, partial [Sphaerochaeta sp.]|nr:branched-chain amino acid ABC transporter permease [Sphaerochaeta sp.]